VCDFQFQPGFTHFGSFADYVTIHYADENLVRLPEDMPFETAASLGCRFATSFRAIVDQGRVAQDQWVVVHGCGGVGLSAIMIATALGAKVVAVDLSDEKLAIAKQIGAVAGLNVKTKEKVAEAIRDMTDGGAHVSVDAIGNADACIHSIASLRKRGRHVQIGLMVGNDSRPGIPMDKVIANELEIVGSHGMQAYRYVEMLKLISNGSLSPEKLIGQTITLEESINVLTSMNTFTSSGVTIISMATGDL
jgi:alcohol dehydrogenase